jgi:hypothetical protein
MFVSITTARGHTARFHAGCDNNGAKKICTGAGLKV